MTKRIRFHQLNNFARLRTELDQRFGARLANFDQTKRLQAREEALKFLQINGFNVDAEIEWVTWSDPKDYTISLLKWT